MTTAEIGLIEQARRSMAALKAGLVAANKDLEAAHVAAEAAEAKVKALTKDLQQNDTKYGALKGEAALQCLDLSEKLQAELATATQNQIQVRQRISDAVQRVEAMKTAIRRDEPRERDASIKAAKLAREILILEKSNAGIEDVIVSIDSLWQAAVNTKELIDKSNRVHALLQQAEDVLRSARLEANNQINTLRTKRTELARYGN